MGKEEKGKESVSCFSVEGKTFNEARLLKLR